MVSLLMIPWVGRNRGQWEADDIWPGHSSWSQGYISQFSVSRGLVGVLVRGQYLHPKGLGNPEAPPLANPSQAGAARVLLLSAGSSTRGCLETPVLVVGAFLLP